MSPRDSPRRILHFAWSGHIGGAPRAIYQLVRGQLEHGDLPAVAFAQPQGEYYDRICDLGCNVLDMKLDEDWRVWKATKARRLISEYRIHHFHAAELTLGLASILSGDAVRVYTHRAGAAAYGGRRRVRYRLFGFYLRRYFQGLSGNTMHAIKAGEALFGADRSRWQLTYNGLYFEELEATRPRSEVSRELGFGPDPSWVIATSGSLRKWKRMDKILEATAKLGRNDHRLLMIGDGPARIELETLARRLGIADRITITGMKERVGDYLQLADVFVLPSNSAESFGNSAVEAMALGIPTIVLEDGGGLREHITDGQTGLVVGSVDELMRALALLQDDRELGMRLGDQARAFVRSKYTPVRMVEAYDRLYQGAEGTVTSRI